MMTNKPICLLNKSSSTIGTLDVELRDDLYEGIISLDEMPSELRELFERFEEIVEGQMFSLLDEIEQEIESASFRVLFENGKESGITDLQVFPSTKAVSFKIRQAITVK